VLYKVTVGRDASLGTAEEVVAWMSRAEGAPTVPKGPGGLEAYMRGVAARVAERTEADRVDVSSPLSFLESLRDAGLLRLEERSESSTERADPKDVLEQGILTFGDDVDPEDLA
jgi:hypothetical protein